MREARTSFGLRRLFVLVAGILLAAAFEPAQAQLFDTETVPRPPADVPGAPPVPSVLAPSLNLAPPGGGAQPVPKVPSPLPVPPSIAPADKGGQVTLALAARFGRDMPAINGGLYWRIYPNRPDPVGGFKPIKEDRSANPTFALPPGGYVVSVAFGLLTAAKPVQLRSEPVREIFELAAGGLRIEGRVGDARIPPGQISFDIYKGSQFEPGDKRPLAHAVATGDVILIPEGTYHVVSNYGDGNAVVRSDIRVQAGKLTDATITHRAAIITLKLVNERGGEALANTQWSVLTPGGDVIKESIGAFPRVILAEGEYRAIARNENTTHERDFKVITGVDGEVEVLTRRNY
jgi:hypothetical protein